MVAVLVWQEQLMVREPKSMIGLLEGVKEGDVAFLELWRLILVMVRIIQASQSVQAWQMIILHRLHPVGLRAASLTQSQSECEITARTAPLGRRPSSR